MSGRRAAVSGLEGKFRGTRDNVPLAVSVIVIAVLALSLGDALVKGVSDSFSLWQIFVGRSAIACPALLLIVWVQTGRVQSGRGQAKRAQTGGRLGPVLLPRHFGWTALRSLMLAFMWVAYYAALPHVAFSIAAATYYTLPLFITLLAALFLGEPVGRKGWLAVVLGFLGVLLILKPNAADFNAFALLPLGSAVLYAGAMVLTRSKCRDETPLCLSFALNAAFLIVGLVASGLVWLFPESGSNDFLLGQWAPMGQWEWLALAGLAVAAIIGSVGGAYAYQKAPASIVATFDFSYLAFAALWGLALFGEIPDGVAVVGILLIATGGILAVRR